MDLADVAVFVESVQAGSLAAAARRLNLAPMAASRRLAALEEELGVRLLHRTTRALALSAEGEAFLPFAQALLADAASGRDAVRPEGAAVAGLLRVTTSVPFGRKVLVPLAARFMRDNPEVRIDVLLTESVVDIVAQGLDLAVRIAPLRDNRLVARRLADSPRVLCASPEYLASRGAPQGLADLAAHECLAVSGATHWDFRSGGRAVRQRVAGRFSANTTEGLLQAAVEGLGIVDLAAWNVAEDVAAGRLVVLPLADAAPEPLAIWAVFPTARMLPTRVRRFVDALAADLRGADV